MPRTTQEQVRAVIPDVGDNVNIEQHITTAHALTNYIVTKDLNGVLTAGLLLAIETYLAAHYCALKDPQYESKRTGGASGKFQTAKKDMGLNATDWGQQAVALDVTGGLNQIAEGTKNVSFIWLGKPVNQQVEYWDRN